MPSTSTSSWRWRGRRAAEPCSAGGPLGEPVGDQASEPRCGLDPQLDAQQLAEGPELPRRRAHVALGQVGRDQNPLGAVSQRVQLDRIEGHPGCGAVPAGGGEAAGGGLECVQPELAEPFTFDDDPVVVPVREQLAGLPPRERVAAEAVAVVAAVGGVAAVGADVFEEARAPRVKLVQIDLDGLIKRDVQPRTTTRPGQ